MKKILVFMGITAAVGILYACDGSGSKNSAKTDQVTDTTGITATVPVVSTVVTVPTVSAPIITQPLTANGNVAAVRAANVSKALALSFDSSPSFLSFGDPARKPVVNQGINGQRIVETVLELQRQAAELVEKNRTVGKQVAAVSVNSCPDGGAESSNTVDINTTVQAFTACLKENKYQDGTITLTRGTEVTQGIKLITIGYEPGGYVKRMYETAENYTMTLGSLDPSTGNAMFMINGTGNKIDYVSGISDKLMYESFRLNTSVRKLGDVTTTFMEIDGAVSMDIFNDVKFTAIARASGMTFDSFLVTSAVNLADNSTALEVAGTFAVVTNEHCLDGTFIITTQAPIIISGNKTISGQMTVNGVVILFNSDGTVTASIDNVRQILGTDGAPACTLSF